MGLQRMKIVSKNIPLIESFAPVGPMVSIYLEGAYLAYNSAAVEGSIAS
jgi:hypothetical protein